MSRYHRTSTIYKDRECLVEALHDMGYQNVEVNDEAQQLIDYHGHATHYTDPTGDKANVIVRRQHIDSAANDLGFVFNKQTGVFDQVVSEFDSGKHNASWLKQLEVNYAHRRVLKTTKRLGFHLKYKPVRKNGKIILEVMR